jgi:antitoxin FitA
VTGEWAGVLNRFAAYGKVAFMQTLRVELSDQTANKLRDAAQRLGVTPESLAQICVEEMLTRLDQDFVAAASYVLDKNAELYRRLSS